MPMQLTSWARGTACLAAAWLVAGAAQAGLYPIAPPGTLLGPMNFIQQVPEASPGIPTVGNTVIGDSLYDHPGGFRTGGPEPGAYFIGVFSPSARPPDLASNAFGVYLWETTSFGLTQDPGPGIRLGHWDGVAFEGYGLMIAALYNDTGAVAPDGFALNSSFTPFSSFQIAGNPVVNAVRIEALDGHHNQVTAVAIIPEPAGALLMATALAALVVRIGTGTTRLGKGRIVSARAARRNARCVQDGS